ncbi:MAG TPA: protease complex subunit PrcB family protein [Blastocatellia bacterium]|nr:protease complex subunit PrcB family protein [Blastocatellia bacterium]
MGTPSVNHLRHIASLTFLVLIFGSIASGQLPPPSVPFETIEKYSFGGHREKNNYVITNREDWQSLWNVAHSNLEPRPPLPEVDFSERMIIAVFQGEQLTGGYTITVTDLVKKGRKLRVKVREVSPGASCGVVAALTQPYHIIETDKARKVRFDVQQETKDCQ